MKQIVAIMSLCCVITHFQYHYGMESKEAKPPTTASTSSTTSTTASVVQEHTHQQEERTPEQQYLHHFKSILRETLQRFHQPTDNVQINVKSLETDDPVAYDPKTQTFTIDPRITDKKYLPINPEKSSWTSVPPAYHFYAYMLARYHIQTVRKGNQTNLAMLKTNLEYLLHHDRHYDAVLYAVIRSLMNIIKNNHSSENAREEYNTIRSYLERCEYKIKTQIIKQPNNALTICLTLNAQVSHKDGTKTDRTLGTTTSLVTGVSPTAYTTIEQLINPHTATQATTHSPTREEEKTQSKSSIFSFLCGLFTQ